MAFGGSDGSNEITTNVSTYNNGTWSSNTYQSSVTFTIGGTSGNRRIAAIEVYCYSADNFADDFLSGTGCDANGVETPTVNWTTMNNKYNLLFKNDKDTLKSTSASQSGTDIQKAMTRYDYIVGKYTTSVYSDFIGRNPAPVGHNANIIIGNKDNSSAMVNLVILSCLSLVGLSSYFFYKKKKR